MAAPDPLIDQTLRDSRDRIERIVAEGRFWIFAAVVVQTVVMQVVFADGNWLPTIYFGAIFLYAAGVRAHVRRHGAAVTLSYAALAIDLVVVAASCWVFGQLSPPGERDDSLLWAVHTTAPGILLVLLTTVARNDARMAAFGAVVGASAFLWVMIVMRSFEPPQVVVATLIVLTAVVGRLTARESRQRLDRLVRLQLLRRFLPSEAVDRVMEQDLERVMDLGGSQRTVTLMATDLRGFTAMSERLTPPEVIEQLNAYHAAMHAEIDHHGGMLDKFIGDGALVVFGLHDLIGDAGARSAVECAAAMLGRLERLNRERAAAGRGPLAMGIGIHTGTVVAGNLGVPGRRLEFTVIGDAVNIASRLESLTKERGVPVLVSAATVERLGALSGLVELGTSAVKGRAEPLTVFGLGARAHAAGAE